MNIKSLTIKNTKSFGEEVNIDFQDNLNILIGPNAGGKSNLIDILNVVLIRFFVYPWRIHSDVDGDTGHIIRQYFQNRRDNIFNPIDRFLDKHNRRLNEDQEIKITLGSEVEDMKNIEIILTNSEKLTVFESNNYHNSSYVKTFVDSLKNFYPDQLKNKTLQYTIRNYTLETSDTDQRVFLDYLNNFDLYSLLIGKYNNSVGKRQRIQQLFPP